MLRIKRALLQDGAKQNCVYSDVISDNKLIV